MDGEPRDAATTRAVARPAGLVGAAAGFLGEGAVGILDLLYPPRCVVCDTLGGSYLCSECSAAIERIRGPVCVRCGLPLSEPGLCGQCRDAPRSFRSARSVGRYDGVLRDLILRFKYSPARPLAGPLADLLLSCMIERRALNPDRFDVILPVPIHPLRLRARDYNQSAELATALALRLRLRSDCRSLRKIRETRPQTTLAARERRTNLRGAFAVRPDGSVVGQRVLLVDDVMTTGATAEECSRVLLEAGAREVRVLTLAREAGRL